MRCQYCPPPPGETCPGEFSDCDELLPKLSTVDDSETTQYYSKTLKDKFLTKLNEKGI